MVMYAIVSLTVIIFMDVTQRSQFQFCTIDLKSHLIALFGGALRDIQKRLRGRRCMLVKFRQRKNKNYLQHIHVDFNPYH